MPVDAKNVTAKLKSKYVRILKIIRILSLWSYELEDDPHKSEDVWNAKDLKFHTPDVPRPQTSQYWFFL